MPAPTIGDEIKLLTAQMKTRGTHGFYILEQALKNLCGTKSTALIEINRSLIHETPGYIKLRDFEGTALEAERLHLFHQTGITPDSYGIFDQ